MAMKDLQRRAVRAGKIRTGKSVRDANGKVRPEKLTRFLITTDSPNIASAVAAAYGGKVEPYLPQAGTAQRGWQVLVDVDEIPVAVPPHTNVVAAWWEQWSGGGLKVRCDGETASVWGEVDDRGESKGEQRRPCLCPADLMERADGAARSTPTACKPTTRVALILPDVPGTGTFTVESHGLSAAREMIGVAEAMERALAAGVMLPAMLRLEQRSGVRRPGERTNSFAVPTLQLLHSPRQLLEMATQGASASALPPPPPPLAISAGPSDEAGAPDGQQSAAGPDYLGDLSDREKAAQRAADAAAKAAEAQDVATVFAIGKQARDAGLMEIHVETSPNLLEELGSYLIGLHAALTGASS